MGKARYRKASKAKKNNGGAAVGLVGDSEGFVASLKSEWADCVRLALEESVKSGEITQAQAEQSFNSLCGSLKVV
jgi:uncharacterized protein (DUF111 family)